MVIKVRLNPRKQAAVQEFLLITMMIITTKATPKSRPESLSLSHKDELYFEA